MIRIRLQPLDLELTSGGDERLLDRIDDLVGERAVAGVPLSCRGASCGVCRARVLCGAGSLAAASRHECDTLQRLGAAADERLACQLWIRAGACEEVELAFTALTVSES